MAKESQKLTAGNGTIPIISVPLATAATVQLLQQLIGLLLWNAGPQLCMQPGTH